MTASRARARDSKHAGSIEIESFSWGVSQTSTVGGPGGSGGAGKASFQDFSFLTRTSQASPTLFLACASGQHLKQATLFVRKAGCKQEDYLIIKMSDILVSSFKQDGDTTPEPGTSPDTTPTEALSLNFSRIDFSYKPQNPDGSLGQPVQAGWDLRSNKKV